jgi:hypothetical protein
MLKPTVFILLAIALAHFTSLVVSQSLCTNLKTNFSIVYNSNVAVCCNGTLFAGNACCGSLGYYIEPNATKVCCNNGTHVVLGKGNLCCNNIIPYYNNSQVCCAKTVQNGDTCCDSQFGYNSKYQTCCNKTVQTGNKCCGNLGYDSKYLSCCNGTISNGKTCCGKMAYNLNSGQTCCADRVQWGDSCCGNFSYNSKRG